MAAADGAPLPIAPLVVVVLADLVLPLGHVDRLGLPERECVDRTGGPTPTGLAMAVPSALRIPRDLNRDSAAEALSLVSRLIRAHVFSSDRLTAASRCSISTTPAARRLRGRPYGWRTHGLVRSSRRGRRRRRRR